MAYKEIICPVCGSNSLNDLEKGGLKCQSCGAFIENESVFNDINAIISYLNGSQFEVVETSDEDADKK